MDFKASELMNETVIACLPETRIEDVVRTLAEHEISGMPVIDVRRRVIGIISESDLLLADEMEARRVKTALFGFYILRESVMERLAELRGVEVQDVMTRDVITFGPEAKVRDIAQTLHNRRINRVPIVDEEGKLLGILSRGDIIRALAGQIAQRETE